MELFAGMARAAVPGAMGAGILTAVWHEQVPFTATCRSDTIGACLGYGYPALVVGPLVVTAVVWLVLRAAGVERPLPAALLGALVTGGGILLDQATRVPSGPSPVWLAVLLAVIGFAAGVSVMTIPLPLVARGGLALLLLLPWAAAPRLRQDTRQDELRDGFARVGLPLVVPEVEGYQVSAARALVGRRILSVTTQRGAGRISILVVPLPADFAPPGRCGPARADLALTEGGRVPSAPPPCRAAGTDHWVRTEGEEVHLVRRSGALVLLSPGGEVPAADVATAATRLTEVSPARLAELAVR